LAYAKTAVFTNDNIPEALQKAHNTKPGVWGKIIVLKGQLLYRILEPSESEYNLTPKSPGVVEPTILHEVKPLGKVTFYVEFYR